jgi:CelD/BcsL family acetyltransferase involved in cellulose biosynthesis
VPPGGQAGRTVVDEALEAEWESLALTTGAAPFLRPGWVRAWMAAFAPGRQLHAVVVRRGPELVALLPVLVSRRGVAVPVNAQTPLMEPVAADEHALGALAAGLRGGARRADLRFLPTGERESALVAAARERGDLWLRESTRRSPYTRVDGDWEAFRREVLSAQRRKTLRRRERLLSSRGRVGLEVLDGQQDLDALVAEGFALEAAGWKGAQGTAVLSRPDTEHFYRSVARWAAQAGILRLYFLRLDARAIGFMFQIEQGGTTYSLKTTYAEDLRDVGPGILMKHRMLAEAFARPDLRRAEFLGEDEPYKLEFATGVREQVRLRLFARGVVGRVERGSAVAVSGLRAEARRRLSPEARRRILASVDRLRR